MMMLDAIENFGNGSDSQIIGRIENLGYCTRVRIHLSVFVTSGGKKKHS